MSEGIGTGAGDQIAELAARLRARHALGRSDGLNRLFDYLVDCAAAGTRPKEFEVAAAVFGRSSSFDGAQDASVRVAVHRLRRKLDDFYAGPGRDEPVRLCIPRGEYRMVAESRGDPAASGVAAPDAARALPRRWRLWIAAAAAALVALNLAAWGAFWTTHGADRTLARAQGSAPWSGLLKDGDPTLLVLGDYYIFGEIDEQAGIDRLIRQYSINSSADLDDWLMDNPKAMGRYRDLDLYYLPVGAAFALRSVVPLLSHGAARGESVRVVMASDLTPEMLKRNNIVYLGYISGLGVLRNPVFAGSRFSVGETYDELVDNAGHHIYRSQEGGPAQGDAARRDYGYVAAFRGPAGNRIVIIAGDRDMGLQQAAEAMASPDALKALTQTAGTGENFEGLYEVQGLGRASLGGKLVSASPRTKADPWTAQPNLSFPIG
ncbi:MAG: hypothetical protein JSS35_16705 [Proteobacteria bacterium]|nr:hypothetical protein [Pseudomonadota bacterium]